MWSSGTHVPWVFDITGAALALSVITLCYSAQALQGGRGEDPRIRNLTRRASGLAGLILAGYVALYLSHGVGGAVPLLLYLMRLDEWSWTVCLTVMAWAALVLASTIALRRGLAGPIGDRFSIPYGIWLLQLGLFGAAWFFGAFLPQPSYRDWPLGWQATEAVNLILRCCYLAGGADAACGILLAVLTGGGGSGRGLADRQREQRTVHLHPARE
jgi:hypothetical protein